MPHFYTFTTNHLLFYRICCVDIALLTFVFEWRWKYPPTAFEKLLKGCLGNASSCCLVPYVARAIHKDKKSKSLRGAF